MAANGVVVQVLLQQQLMVAAVVGTSCCWVQSKGLHVCAHDPSRVAQPLAMQSNGNTQGCSVLISPLDDISGRALHQSGSSAVSHATALHGFITGVGFHSSTTGQPVKTADTWSGVALLRRFRHDMHA